MRRVYQLFRCRLLIKHHQTLNLLTINTLLHYRAFSPPLFPPFISLFLFLFPFGSLCLSVSLSAGVALSLFLPLYQTPLNTGQINYLMHLSLSARAQSNLPRSPFTDAFSHKKSGLTREKRQFFSVVFFFLDKETASSSSFFCDSFLVPLSLISPELIKLQKHVL